GRAARARLRRAAARQVPRARADPALRPDARLLLGRLHLLPLWARRGRDRALPRAARRGLDAPAARAGGAAREPPLLLLAGLGVAEDGAAAGARHPRRGVAVALGDGHAPGAEPDAAERATARRRRVSGHGARRRVGGA